ncbi:chitobiase/beta-hexosaminidase C-terminal domain-containing protein [Algoriphagus halophytocola]|uniref:Chitobiase/beta-hexosaminidase C-terminal domain-containing protein n=1 Tax=Algoriphagus halophytocola TaxID=2991499 RepID=A0ABY6MIM9_9BACT|nr:MULTISPECIES: c-type cytochrome domain-containing protein [unclassified Algoriphagus]UZD23329.1 chitobiase/beta-hexosaminidase C-terminal domain-containing protein [Algoriphagus sp. TR-M5]WBL44624.1 chitobiase/beta-hexosaminidase C-terminal domain-containing protein [Algoriphagus sp. TR-M9]
MITLSKLRSILENLLFAWIGLVFIFTLGGEALYTPQWIQVIGRAHPLILHFPIVLLLVGMLFIWLPDVERKPEVKEVIELFYLTGCNFAGITVILGLILAQEDYSGDLLTWHKWGGILLFTGCTLLYFIRSKKQSLLKVGSLVLAMTIILTGHWGADLTHGENYLLSPILKKQEEKIALSDAELYPHVIRPILEAKCISCHKEGKIKGELRLDHLDGIKKGGKSGPFVVEGKLHESLLIERINLPLEEEEHMPPKNKAQLSEEEKEILSAWVASGADFEQKVVELSPDTELFKLTSIKFETNKSYNFDPAADQDIADLNNAFRTVSPKYPESPALEVSYFGISAFQPESLADLKQIKEQLVLLNLNKMPLAEVDLNFLINFPNLEELQLNFTDLTPKQLSLISKLESLEVLAISGNEVSKESLAALAQMKNLKKLYLWNTGLDSSDQDFIQESLPETTIDFGFDGKGITYELNAPIIKQEKTIYTDSLKIELSHPIKTAQIRYTLDGTEPDSLQSAVYSQPIFVNQTGKINARAFAKEWVGSETAKSVFIHAGIQPKSYSLQFQPAEKYSAAGAATLFDLEKGLNSNFSQKWLGYQDDPMVLTLDLEEGKQPSEVSLSLLYHESPHIFPPESVEIQGFSEGVWRLLSQASPEMPNETKTARSEMITLRIDDPDFEKLRITVRPLSRLPKWHPNAGDKGWVFVDEVILNK